MKPNVTHAITYIELKVRVRAAINTLKAACIYRLTRN